MADTRKVRVETPSRKTAREFPIPACVDFTDACWELARALLRLEEESLDAAEIIFSSEDGEKATYKMFHNGFIVAFEEYDDESSVTFRTDVNGPEIIFEAGVSRKEGELLFEALERILRRIVFEPAF